MNKVEINFRKFDEISNFDIKKIKKILKNSFNKKETDIIDILENTIIVTVKTKEIKEKIVAVSFLLCPTFDLLNTQNDIYINIKKQGITENDCYLYNLCVHNKKRKNGYGKIILQKCQDYVSTLLKKKIMLFVENGNIPAICLYNKLGYNVHKSTPNGFIMEKNLQ